MKIKISNLILTTLISLSLGGTNFILSGCSIKATATKGSTNASLTLALKSSLNISQTAVTLNQDNPDYLSHSWSEPLDLGAFNQANLNIFSNSQPTEVSASATGLSNLEYFITSIEICKDLTTTGSGYSNPVGCLTLYSGPTDATLNAVPGIMTSALYIAEANYARTFTGTGFIDLMSATSRASLASTLSLTSDNVGSYNYGIVAFAHAVRLKADLANGSTHLYTHDGTSQTFTGPPSGVQTVSTTALTQTPAELATITLTNGGNWFKFQSPFVITADDLAANTNYNLDLTFNPDSIVTGSAGVNMQDGMPLIDGSTTSANNVITVPLLDLTPVPRKSTQFTVKETYQGTAGSYGQDWRLELYSINGDTTKTVYGATFAAVPISSSTALFSAPKISFIQTNADKSMSFQDYSKTAIISNFTRISTLNSTTTAQVACGYIAACTVPYQVTFKLTGLTVLE